MRKILYSLICIMMLLDSYSFYICEVFGQGFCNCQLLTKLPVSDWLLWGGGKYFVLRLKILRVIKTSCLMNATVVGITVFQYSDCHYIMSVDRVHCEYGSDCCFEISTKFSCDTELVELNFVINLEWQ